MKNKTMVWSTVLCLTPILLGVAMYDQLPEMVPTHFDLAGNPDGWNSRELTVFGMPAFLAALNALCHWTAGKNKAMEKVSPKVLLLVAYWTIPALSLILMPMMLFTAVGVEMPISFLMSLLVGGLFVVVGNYLPKCKPNRYMGIKLPWTFASEENWRKTHRFGGFVWVGAGLVSIAGTLLGVPEVMLAAIFAAILLPTVYSYREFKQEQR